MPDLQSTDVQLRDISSTNTTVQIQHDWITRPASSSAQHTDHNVFNCILLCNKKRHFTAHHGNNRRERTRWIPVHPDDLTSSDRSSFSITGSIQPQRGVWRERASNEPLFLPLMIPHHSLHQHVSLPTHVSITLPTSIDTSSSPWTHFLCLLRSFIFAFSRCFRIMKRLLRLLCGKTPRNHNTAQAQLRNSNGQRIGMGSKTERC